MSDNTRLRTRSTNCTGTTSSRFAHGLLEVDSIEIKVIDIDNELDPISPSQESPAVQYDGLMQGHLQPVDSLPPGLATTEAMRRLS